MTEMISYTPHGVVELSNLKATECGHIVNLLVNEESGIDNGSFVTFDIADASEGYASTGLGIDVLGTAMVPSTDDAVYLVASMPMIYEDYTPKMLEESNFFNGMGEVARCFEVKLGDRFGLSKECFTNPEDVAVGKYVIINGEGYKSTVSDSMGDGAFVGYIYAQAANGNWYVFVLKNGSGSAPGPQPVGRLTMPVPELNMWVNDEAPVIALYDGVVVYSSDEVSFASSDTSIVNIVETNMYYGIKAVGMGEAVITATYLSTEETASWTITVSNVTDQTPQIRAIVNVNDQFTEGALKMGDRYLSPVLQARIADETYPAPTEVDRKWIAFAPMGGTVVIEDNQVIVDGASMVVILVYVSYESEAYGAGTVAGIYFAPIQ